MLLELAGEVLWIVKSETSGCKSCAKSVKQVDLHALTEGEKFFRPSEYTGLSPLYGAACRI